jgi:tyrosyl-tRNA synthetase
MVEEEVSGLALAGGTARPGEQDKVDNVVRVLQRRGLVHQITETDLEQAAASERLTVYCGFDPTAPSLHVGHLIQVLVLAHFQRQGHRVIALLGGGTGLIGDPSGRSEERKLLSAEETAANVARLRQQISPFLDFTGPNAAIMADNVTWLGQWRLTDFLRDIGKHFTVNTMLAKESVRARLEDREQGISFTEFSYMLLQAADFLQLHQDYGCAVQVGGSDQWGNITAGVDLIRRVTGHTAHGLTTPLLTTSAGVKFGKSAGNAVWLDPEMTSPYQFYQFWINADDRDVIRFLKIFTFLDLEEIAALEQSLLVAPEEHAAQRALAVQITGRVYGEQVLASVQIASEILFGETERPLAGLFDEQVTALLAREVPVARVTRESLGAGLPAVDAVTAIGLAKSKSQVRQLIAQGGLSINGAVCRDATATLRDGDLLGGRAVLVRVGRRHYGLLLVK